ncbi:MAG: FumA C-terminus/TtdB family hydratase beta subunit [Candidatus Omnitrophica bacterium]|nr:FumA C-terminus/TtdB family hydratase beta subunit [Candidatus Omnitrophota bacterium]
MNKGRWKIADTVLYTGTLYTARDQAHKRLVETIRAGKNPPIDLAEAVIYYAGPTPSPVKNMIGACGPTTSSRMDVFTPILLEHGLRAMVGKGARSEEVRKAIKKYGAVYFLTIAGAGAYLSTKIKSARVVAYKDLGAEAIYRLEVEDFPLIVGIDARGKSIY